VRLNSEQSKPSTSTDEETTAAPKQKQLSASSPAEKLEDARRKLNELRAAEGAKAIQIADANSSVIQSPPPTDFTIDLYLINGFPRNARIQISGPSVSNQSVSSSSSDSSRASSSTQKDLPSTSGSKDASTVPSKSSNSSTEAQKQVPASTAKSSSTSKSNTRKDLEVEKKKEMPEKIQATMKGSTSAKPSTSKQKQSTTNSSKSSTSTQKQHLASKAKSPASLPKKKTKKELEPEKKKIGMFQRITSAMMGRKH
jgi:hypothetical protein